MEDFAFKVFLASDAASGKVFGTRVSSSLEDWKRGDFGPQLPHFGPRSVVFRDNIRTSRFRPKSYTKFSVKFDFFDPSIGQFSKTFVGSKVALRRTIMNLKFTQIYRKLYDRFTSIPGNKNGILFGIFWVFFGIRVPVQVFEKQCN